MLPATFLHRAKADPALYAEFFGVTVRFEAEADDFSFSRDLLMAPLLTADGTLAKMLADHRPALGPKAANDPLVARTQAVIDELLAKAEGTLGVDEVATQLEMSSRTLQRRLGESGSSCSELIDDARRRLAEKLLANEGVLLANVAYTLDFQDPTAFYRAFRRWTGKSPRAFQRALRDRS